MTDFEVPYLFGGRAMWEPPLEGLRVGGSAQALRFNSKFNLTVPLGHAARCPGRRPALFPLARLGRVYLPRFDAGRRVRSLARRCGDQQGYPRPASSTSATM